MTPRTTLIYITLTLSFLTCCSGDRCPISFPDFSKVPKKPFIYITEKIDDDTYSVIGQFWLGSEHKMVSGQMKSDCKAFHFRIDSLSESDILLFDFDKPVGESYQIALTDANKRYVFDVKTDSVVQTSGDKVFKFRIINGFRPDDGTSDLVYFASLERGIIGSYISELINGQELYAEPRGDILSDYIDYSKKIQGRIL